MEQKCFFGRTDRKVYLQSNFAETNIFFSICRVVKILCGGYGVFLKIVIFLDCWKEVKGTVFVEHGKKPTVEEDGLMRKFHLETS